MVLMKNSDPSFRKTIILHRRSLRSFGLFLEEISELMQYHVKKLYTLGGYKIDSIQSLLQCPSVLVCMGREPSHPSIIENFRKTSDEKFPKLSVKSRSAGCIKGDQKDSAKKSVIHSNFETGNKTTQQSVSSDKSGPDGTDSPDIVNSYPPTDDRLRQDDIEKRVRVNKDGSLSMEMNVRFRLQNNEMLHWSTEVRKTPGGTCEYRKGDSNLYFSSYPESDNVAAMEKDEAFFTEGLKDKEKAKNQTEEEGEMERDLSSAMSVKSNASCRSVSETTANQPKRNEHHEICHTDSNESGQSQTLSSSDIPKEMCGCPEDTAKKTTNGDSKVTDMDNKSGKSSKCKGIDADDFDLVPSSLPNASPTEVVNEWLKTLPADGDICDIEELNENCSGQKNSDTTQEIERVGSKEKDDTNTPNDPNERIVENSVSNNDCQINTEAPNEENTSTRTDDASKIFNSSIQVMKVLLNPKLDRCNSLPEISPVYGRKLSTSARGLLDCLLKLQLIDHDPKNAKEKDGRYQELINILQSLWLCDLPENEQILKNGDPNSLDDDFHHTSSSGVDVHSGSTASGNSSDGVKGSNEVNVDATHPQISEDVFTTVQNLCEVETESDEKKAKEMYAQEQKENGQKGNEPRDLSETSKSSIKSSGNHSDDQKLLEVETDSQEDTSSEGPLLIQREQLAEMISQDDPVWVLTLLTKIEKQFMTHYINAMNEFKVRWNMEDSDQLDCMIELKAEVHKIQASIDRELWKIQSQKRKPKPPKEPRARASTTQMERRINRLKNKLEQSSEKVTIQ
ncbi:LOW QUALITY PROTEIN: uncharacterized protein KZ484_013178 [Pholidichthys leucotaenia]